MNEELSKADKEMLIANSMKAIRDGDSKQTVLKNKEICIGYMNRIIKHYQNSSEIVGNQEDIELEEQGYNLSPDTYKDPWEKF